MCVNDSWENNIIKEKVYPPPWRHERAKVNIGKKKKKVFGFKIYLCPLGKKVFMKLTMTNIYMEKEKKDI